MRSSSAVAAELVITSKPCRFYAGAGSGATCPRPLLLAACTGWEHLSIVNLDFISAIRRNHLNRYRLIACMQPDLTQACGCRHSSLLLVAPHRLSLDKCTPRFVLRPAVFQLFLPIPTQSLAISRTVDGAPCEKACQEDHGPTGEES